VPQPSESRYVAIPGVRAKFDSPDSHRYATHRFLFPFYERYSYAACTYLRSCRIVLAALTSPAPNAAADEGDQVTVDNAFELAADQAQDSFGVVMHASDYVAVDGIPGDEQAIWVLPEGVAPDTVTTTIDDGGNTDTGGEGESVPISLANDNDPTIDGAAFRWQTPICPARYTEDSGWFLHCWRWGVVQTTATRIEITTFSNSMELAKATLVTDCLSAVWRMNAFPALLH
jgi:hypothetical protein